MEKLLALAQHLDIPYIEDGTDIHFGVKLEDYEDSEAGLLICEWAAKQDELIDFENEVEVSGDYYTYDGEEYLILTDSEADTMAEEYAENLIEDCYLTKEIKESWIYNYFDMNSAIQDILNDGRGPLLSGYDNEENEQKVNETWYYIYRTN